MPKNKIKHKNKLKELTKIQYLPVILLLVSFIFIANQRNNTGVLGEDNNSQSHGSNVGVANIHANENGKINSSKKKDSSGKENNSDQSPSPQYNPDVVESPIPSPSLSPTEDSFFQNTPGLSTSSDNINNPSNTNSPTPANNNNNTEDSAPPQAQSSSFSSGVIDVSSKVEDDNQKVIVKTSDQKKTVNLNERGTQVIINNNNGKITVTAKKSDGTKVQLDTEDFLSIQPVFNSEAQAENADIQQFGDKYLLRYKDTVAETSIPLSILIGNQVRALTNEGEKDIKMMPGDAVQALIDKKVLSSSTILPTLDNNGNIVTLSHKVKLVEINHGLAYEVMGVHQKYLLAFIPVSVNQTVQISEENGKILSINQSPLDKIKDVLSFNP